MSTPEPEDETAQELRPAARRPISRRVLLLGGLAVLLGGGAIAAWELFGDHADGNGDDGEDTDAFRAAFPRDGLVTNEYAFRNPDAKGAHNDPDWVVTSGSLFAHGGAGWTGLPDGQSPGVSSDQHNGSSVFRLVTRRRDFRDCTVKVEVRLQPPGTTSRTPKQDWDGGHIWLRYRAPDDLYAISFRRRDGVVVIKRKTPDPAGIGAAGEQGDYVTVAEGKAAFPYGEWHTVTASAVNHPDGVRLVLAIDGRTVLDTIDKDAKRISLPGGVGLRVDNTELDFRNFTADPAAGL
ncbi:family 16 glycoside hydrolase [Kitasatospora sp. McL0602]|uniref:family 16 glycoside hydrolase n=1 Tax=Kitasatospora sp. McL0602 TaxID=3439530 RepID=UPI003F8B385A